MFGHLPPSDPRPCTEPSAPSQSSPSRHSLRCKRGRSEHCMTPVPVVGPVRNLVPAANRPDRDTPTSRNSTFELRHHKHSQTRAVRDTRGNSHRSQSVSSNRTPAVSTHRPGFTSHHSASLTTMVPFQFDLPGVARVEHAGIEPVTVTLTPMVPCPVTTDQQNCQIHRFPIALLNT